MIELFKLSVSGVNIVPTILLVIVVLFWLVSILGAIDIDGLDFDLDMDAEGFGADIFSFLKIGDIPVSVYMSILFLIFWILNITVSILTESWGGIPNIVGLIPCFVVAALITRFLTIPLKLILKGLNGNEEVSRDFIGDVGELRFDLKPDKMSQVLIDKGTTLINCVGEQGLELPAGASVRIVKKKDDENLYIVEPF